MRRGPILVAALIGVAVLAAGWQTLTGDGGAASVRTEAAAQETRQASAEPGYLPVFLVVVGTGIASGGFLSGAGQFLVFGLGKASVLVALTLALALFKQGLVTRMRKAVPYVQLASAVLFVLAGAYVIYYWLSYGSALPG